VAPVTGRPEASPVTLAPSDMPPPTVAQPQSEPGLASILEPSDPNPMVNPSSHGARADVPLFDSLVEPRELVEATGRDSEKLRLPTPLATAAAGRGLRDAIDEILQNVPSNVPPNVFPLSEPPPDAAPVESPPNRDHPTVAESVLRELGQLPAAPAPLTASPAPSKVSSPLPAPTPPPPPAQARPDLAATMVAGATAPRAMPSSFPAMSRTLAMEARPDMRPPTASEIDSEERATNRPPNVVSSATAPMPAVPPPPRLPSTAKMRAFVVPQAAVGTVPPPAGTGSSPPRTLPLGTLSPSTPSTPSPPLAQTVPLVPVAAPVSTGSHAPVQGVPQSAPQAQPQSQPQSLPHSSPQSAPHSPHRAPTSASAPQPGSHVTTGPPNRVSAPPASTPPPARRGLPVAALATVLLVSIAVGVGGMFGYVRWKKSHAVVASPATATASTATSAPARTTSATTLASASASPSASALPSASASALPSASASPSASALASAHPVTPADDVPATMGRVKTAGAAPGRRIFVDEKTVGQTPEAVLVKCGTRAIKLGSAGSTQSIDVPCGGEITVADR